MEIKYSYFAHPNNVCISYLEHLIFSIVLSFSLLLGSLKAFVHAIIPSMFITSTTDLVKDIDIKLKTSGCK